jgi:hypothetical protein
MPFSAAAETRAAADPAASILPTARRARRLSKQLSAYDLHPLVERVAARSTNSEVLD